ncbi:uncharacterized protein C4orf17 homolog [Varanus komodoensis]|uniref:uncharacterized protein C4orf17 homolog n=1 Tax=Varanus komodoensis TaxID=61221 RepID=UPI001CF7C623|nr:uncharacterized protein C4orf17 homolog [Varanus komodoensis]
MNINFRAQPELQLMHRESTRPGPKEALYGKGTYFVCRHSPHPKTVCHMKGLNDVPVCVVKDRGYSDASYSFSGPEYSQFRRQAGMNADTFPNNPLPSLVPIVPRPKVADLMRDGITEFTKRAENTPLLKRRDDPLRNYIGDQPQSRSVQERHLVSAQAMPHRPENLENMNYSPSHLEQEIKILEKLRDILQTDSLAEIQEWLAKASPKEKEFVSNFIHSDMTSQDLLHYQQRTSDKNEAEKVNLQDMLKIQKVIQKGSPEDNHQFRTPSKGAQPHNRSQAEQQRDHLLTSQEKIRIPTSDSVYVKHSPSKSVNQESSAHSPAIAQTSSQLLYSRSRSRRSHPS